MWNAWASYRTPPMKSTRRFRAIGVGFFHGRVRYSFATREWSSLAP